MIGFITVGWNDLTRAAGLFDPLFLRWRAAAPMRSTIRSPGALAPKPQWSPCPGSSTAPRPRWAMARWSRYWRRITRRSMRSTRLPFRSAAPTRGARGARFYGGYFRDLDGNKFKLFRKGCRRAKKRAGHEGGAIPTCRTRAAKRFAARCRPIVVVVACSPTFRHCASLAPRTTRTTSKGRPIPLEQRHTASEIHRRVRTW